MESLTVLPLRWHSFFVPLMTTEALVVHIGEKGEVERGRAFAAHWTDVVPRSAFAAVEVDLSRRHIGFAPVQAMFRAASKDLGVDLSQIVLIGSGYAALRALDLALCNALRDVHVIAVDLPPSGVVIGLTPVRGAFRFVQHRRLDDPGELHFGHTAHLLREACLDVRTIILPDEPDPTNRAIGTFLVELVARASRYQPTTRREPGASPQPEDRA
jgi:hypothetical protein